MHGLSWVEMGEGGWMVWTQTDSGGGGLGRYMCYHITWYASMMYYYEITVKIYNTHVLG